MPTAYQIRVKGHLDPRLSMWFDGFTITHTANGHTLLTGTVMDQAALYGVLERCRDLGLTLIAIKQSTEEKMIHVEASEVINARPEKLYAIVRDYRVGHQAILPRPYFTSMVVEEGGVGAGTVIRVKMKVMGQDFDYHMDVAEPEPGRVISETDRITGQRSTFTFEPLNGGTQTRVTIATRAKGSAGLRGVMEKLFVPSVTRRIFRQELRQLADYAQKAV